MDPALARRQILLHASQQFLEGDVVHWFHRLQDGRTGFVGRTHASDNLLWLAWGVVEYVAATGDESLLDERTPYLEAEQPFEPLPAGKHGMGFDPLRSPREDTVYRHCLKAIDLVLDRRMGAHGLPLMGTGDWNDGLDEIGSQGRGESVWLGFFLYYILDRMVGHRGERRRARAARDYYLDAAAGPEGGPGAHLEGRPLPPRHPRRRHRDRREGERRLGDRRPDGRMGRDVGDQPRARADRLRDGPRDPREGEDDPPGLAPAPRGHQALSRPEQRLSRGRPRERDVLPRRPVAGRCGADPGRAVRARGAARRGPRGTVETAYRLWLKISPIPHAVGRARSRPTAASPTSRRPTW